MNLDETTRQSAHVLLDALSAFDDATNPNPNAAIIQALRRLEEVGAVSDLVDDDTGERRLDIRPLLKAVLSLLTSSSVLLLDAHEDWTGLDVIERLRSVVDKM